MRPLPFVQVDLLEFQTRRKSVSTSVERVRTGIGAFSSSNLRCCETLHSNADCCCLSLEDVSQCTDGRGWRRRNKEFCRALLESRNKSHDDWVVFLELELLSCAFPTRCVCKMLRLSYVRGLVVSSEINCTRKFPATSLDRSRVAFFLWDVTKWR